MNVLSVLNKKGGVGKTTIATNMAQGLAALRKRVLIVDNDEQHNLTSSVGLTPKDYTTSLAEAYKAAPRDLERVVSESIYQSFMEGLDVIPGSKALESLDPPKTALLSILQTNVVKSGRYDVVIIDNAPSVGAKTRAAIHCSDFFVLPVQLRQFAIDGLVELYNSLVSEYRVDPLKIFIVRNMYREQDSLCKDASGALAMRYPDNLMKTIIPDNVVFEKMVRSNKTMFYSQTASKGTLQFQRLICEIFQLDEKLMLDIFRQELIKYRADVARDNLKRAQIIKLLPKDKEVA